MKKVYLFNIYDKVGETYLNEKPIMCNGKLNACLAFHNSFIKEKDPLKNPFNPKALELHMQGVLTMTDEGKPTTFDNLDVEVIKGSDITAEINAIMRDRGVDDYIIDDTVEEKTE